MMLLQLALCGDIHPNPGPVSTEALGICHINARSLTALNRLDLIEHDLIIEKHFDIIGITETHLDESVTHINIDSYQFFRKDRNRHGGGVALLLNEHLPCRHRKDLEIDGLELLWVEILFRNKYLLCGVCYRPPGMNQNQVTDFLSKLKFSFDLISNLQSNYSLVLLGDFNDRCGNWYSDHAGSELGTNLLELLSEFDLIQLIDEPTRNQSLLDLIITDSPNFILDYGVMAPPDPDLDHSAVFCKFNVVHQRSNIFQRHIWLYDKGDYHTMCTALENCSWKELENVDLDSAVDIFTEKLRSEMSSHIPNKLVTIRPKDKPWMNGHLRLLLRQCHRLHKRSRRTNSDQDKQLHREKRRMFKTAKKMYIALYNIKQSEKLTNALSDSKEFWKLLKNITPSKKKQVIIPPLVENGSLISKPCDKANVLNAYFVEQSFIEVPPHHSLPRLVYKTDFRLDAVETTPNEVKKILLSLKVKKANGPDGISNLILKKTAEKISIPLAHIFNRSFEMGYFPSSWKCAHVQPLFKSKDRQDKTNYRPISLLPCVSKVQERIVYKRLYEYCESHNLLNERNSGFRQNDSAINRLLYITQNVYKGLDEGKDICIVFLDISKAFDKVWHIGLLFKLRQLGISGKLLDWISSYLSDRRQRVVISGTTSDWEFLHAGVPQGSILGPLLFLIYISDITDGIVSNMNLFADDSLLMEAFTDIYEACTKLNNDLDHLSAWAAQWLVVFSEPKTVYMLLSNRQREAFRNHPDLFLNNICLNEVSNHSNLGVIFSNDMSWNLHIQKILLKANGALSCIQRASMFLTRSTKAHLYKSLVLPIIDYGDVIYDNAPMHLKEKLNQLQRKAALMCTRAYRHTESMKLLQELGWNSLESRRKMHRLNLFYKIKNKLTRPYLSSLCPGTVGERAERYNLRNRNDISKSALRTSKALNSYFPKTANEWNALSPSLRNLTTYNHFKSKLKALIKVEIPHHFVQCNGYPAVLHTRVRLGLSALNDQRFSYNLIDHRHCPFCPRQIENAMHYFLVCPQYAAQRETLMQNISGILPNFNSLSKKQKLHTLLYGTPNINIAMNIRLQNMVELYLVNSHRFEISSVN